MTIANSVNKKVVIGKQSAQGTIAATDLATAQTLRFLKFNQGEEIENYKSAEMRPDKQVGDVNLGPKDCNGSLSGELSPATYKDFLASLLRKAWATAGTIGPISDVTAATTSGATGTFTTAAGKFIETGKFKVGDIVRWTGFAGGSATNNNNHNMMITALTETVMTVLCLDGEAVVNDASGDSVSCAIVGKKCWVPATSHTEDWWTVEQNYADLDLSEVFIDCKPSQASIKAQASGIPTIDINVLGLDVEMKSGASAPYFTAALGITTTEQCQMGNAVILVNGTVQTLATSISFEIKGNNKTLPAVISSQVKPGISDGVVEVTGTVTMYFESATIRDLFRAGTEVAIYAAFPISNSPTADFIAFSLPACKLTGATKDGDQEIVQTIPFQAKFNSAGDNGSTCTVNTLATTISVQDTDA